jgi:hypothetical protein
MNTQLIIENLTNPALLFFLLGIIAVQLKSDLEIPPNSSKFISVYLLFSIGFKGGHELAHSPLTAEMFWSLLIALLCSAIIPVIAFFILRMRLDVSNSAAIAAAYGSVSAVTFVTAITYLEQHDMEFGGHMVAIMALMESPAIIVGVLMLRYFSDKSHEPGATRKIIHHALTNGSVLLILGSLIIGAVTSDAQADGIKPFTTDIFKGFLAVFLLDMGLVSGRQLGAFFKSGYFVTLFAILFPFVVGTTIAWLSQFFCEIPGDRLLFAVLCSSASYIAVPAAMKIVAPEANPGIYIPMALAITFPLNITLGLPWYLSLITG